MDEQKHQTIIFSKNRACQLNLLLDSMVKNAGLFFDRVVVLYKSDEEYLPSYEKVKTKYSGITFTQESDFRKDLINSINEFYEATSFIVDDAVIYQPIMARKTDVIKKLSEDSICFSLRLGLNCEYSHPANINYSIKEYEMIGEYISFDYTKQIGDFAYPLSTDGHIFKTDLIKNLLSQISFNNPNTLEANLQMFLANNSIPKKMHAFTHSKLVSIPVNLVNETFKNRHGLEFGISEKELNNKFMNGESIDLVNLDFTGINGPHKEIKYTFKNKN